MPRVVAACGHVLLCSPPEKRVPHGLVYAAVHQCHCPKSSQCRAYVTSWSCTNAGVMIDNAGTGGACFCLVEDEDRSSPDSAAALLASYFSRSFVFWQGQRTLGRCCSSRQDVAGCQGRSSSVSSRDASVCIARHRSWRVRNAPPCVECTCCRSCDIRPENARLGPLERLVWVEL